MSTANKLQYLIDAKISISAAIEAKGGDVPQELSGYGPAISALPSGGGDLDKLTYVLYEDNKISGYLLEGSISGESGSMGNAVFQNGKVVQLGNAVTEIGTAAFRKISSLIAISIPDSVTSIKNNAFRDMNGLTSITIPDSVTSIGNNVFQNSTGLISATIGNGLSSIGIYAFNSCSGLTSVTIPDSVTSISTGVFSGCSGLSSITIPDSVTSIGNQVFQNCSSLTSITFGNNLTAIGDRAFAGCSSCLIFDFSRATSVPTLAKTSAFSNTNANKKIIVPDALYGQWKTTANWNSSTNGIVDAITKASEA